MVTIIHLPEAPNPKVGPPTHHQPRTYTIVSLWYGMVWHYGLDYRILGEYRGHRTMKQKSQAKLELNLANNTCNLSYLAYHTM